MKPSLTALAIGCSCLIAASPVTADLVVLQYHHVSDSTPPSTSTSNSLFRGQLERIESLELTVAPLQEATRQAIEGELEGRQLIAITFDDAYESVYTNAAPLLDKRGYPYTIFINSDAVGKQGYMTWDQLRELGEKSHVTLANHSADHAHLPKKPGESQDAWHERVTHSLDQAQKDLEKQLPEPAPLFAYPYGEYDEGLEAMLEQRGWYGYGQQSGAIGKTSGPTRLPRFPMANQYGQLNSLKDKLMSRAFPVNADSLPAGIVTENPPELTLNLNQSLNLKLLSCFGSGQGSIPFREIGEKQLAVQAPEAFSARRFRYNCTYPAGNGSYHWLSQQWVDLSRPED